MHRVVNFGSALQAYALQKALFKQGIENEIIDYQFPLFKKKLTLQIVILKLRKIVYNIRTGQFLQKKKEELFFDFYKKNLKMSKLKYDKNNILQNPPVYDGYMTGSDQVWNPQWVKDDMSFFLNFAPENSFKISYASSFTYDNIPAEYKALYSKYLQQYSRISVREESGIKIIKELVHKDAFLVCDPTLLLSADDYSVLVEQSKIKELGPYILVYILNYMYDPYPDVNNIISQVREYLSLPIIYIGGKFTRISNDCIAYENIGPCEFLWLFQHASFVITSSFHGTAFASIYQKPLLAVVKSKDSKDERIKTLLKVLKNEKAIIAYNESLESKSDIKNNSCRTDILEKYRSQSVSYLIDSMRDY